MIAKWKKQELHIYTRFLTELLGLSYNNRLELFSIKYYLVSSDFGEKL